MRWLWSFASKAYEPFRDEIEMLSRDNPRPFANWFPQGQNRVYIPFGRPSDVDEVVFDVLSEAGCEITDYVGGYCQQGKRVFRIPKMIELARINAIKQLDEKNQQGMIYNYDRELKEINEWHQKALDTFNQSAYRGNKSGKDFFIVISQDPHDIAQMSTGRSWTSCMNLVDGSNKQSTYCEVKSGGLVAYLIHSNDMNVENPIARILIRRFANQSGKSVAVQEESVYGNNIPGFQEKVKEWLNERQTSPQPGPYNMQGGEYSDTFNNSFMVAPTKQKDVLNWFRGSAPHSRSIDWWVHVYSEEDKYRDYPIEEYTKAFRTRREAIEYCRDFSRYMYKCEIKPNRHYHSSNMKNEAIKIILNAPRGTYSDEVIDEVANDIMHGSTSYRYNSNLDLLVDKYPEKVPTDLIVDTVPNLYYQMVRNEKDHGKKEEMIAGVADRVSRMLSMDPVDFIVRNKESFPWDSITPDLIRKHMINRTGLLDKDRTFDAIRSSIITPIHEIFSHHKHKRNIPEQIVQQLIHFVNYVVPTFPITRDDNKNKGDIKIPIYRELAHLFAHSGTDTPTVQEFYKSILPLYGDEAQMVTKDGFYQRNPNYSQLNLVTLGFPIAMLGANGKQFIPFMQKNLERVKREYAEVETTMDPRDNAEEKRRLNKDIERYLWIIERLETGQTSGKYRFAQSWRYHFKTTTSPEKQQEQSNIQSQEA